MLDFDYFYKIQGSYGMKNKREKDLAKINYEMSKHFEDTTDCKDVLINGEPSQLIIVKDTDSNVYSKKIKSRHDDKFNLGDYVEWNNQHWIVLKLDPDEDTWNRGYMYLCDILLCWQNKAGDIISRWCYSENYTKYTNGIKENKVIDVGDNQYGLSLPVDNETKVLKRNLRFAIDYEGAVVPDVYKLTNRKVLLNDYRYFNRGGIINLTLSYNAFNDKTDKLVTLDNGQKVWICDYFDMNNNPTTPEDKKTYANIISSGKLIIGSKEYITFIANFYDTDGNLNNTITPVWEIIKPNISNVDNDISIVYENGLCKIKVAENYDLIDKDIIIKVSDGNDSYIGEITMKMEMW
jgi:hypothetical protein